MISKNAHLFKALKEARRTRSLSQSRLGHLLGVPQSYLSELEQGQHDIKLGTFNDWARLLDFELVLVPRQHLPAVSYLMSQSASQGHEQEAPPAYGPLPDSISPPRDS